MAYRQRAASAAASHAEENGEREKSFRHCLDVMERERGASSILKADGTQWVW
jgi:hypothetical protein